ncbi:MAG: hypothetical protein AAF183_15170 [Pseudomonadota bacterium]
MLGLAFKSKGSTCTMRSTNMLIADSDQAATSRFTKARAPHVRLTDLAPPKRPISGNIMQHADVRLKLKMEHMERCLFGPLVIGETGPIRRPWDYDQPDVWLYPNQRGAKARQMPPKKQADKFKALAKELEADKNDALKKLDHETDRADKPEDKKRD